MTARQYYEFQPLDRQIDEHERASLEHMFPGVVATHTRVVFQMQEGILDGALRALLAWHFDAMLHVNDWGARELAFRLPAGAVPKDQLAPWCDGTILTTIRSGQHVLVRVALDESNDEFWLEGDGWLSRLVELRDDLLHGDFRMLHLAWLLGVQFGIRGQATPPRPTALPALTPALRSFVEFFALDEDLLVGASMPLPGERLSGVHHERLSEPWAP